MEHRALRRSGSRCRASSSAAATSAASARRPRSSAAGETEGEAHALMDAAWEAGVTTFDTADAYGGGAAVVIGSWLRSKGPEVRERIVLATKTFNPMAEGEDSGLSAERIRRQIQEADATRRRRRTSLPRSRHGSERPGRRDDRHVGRARRRRQDPGVRRQQRRRRLARGSTPARAAGLGPELLLAARTRGRGGSDQDLRPGRPRLHAVQPAGRRLADREVPPGPGAARRLADDAAPDAYLHFQDDRVFDALEAFEATPASAARPRPPSRSPGCSATRT